MWTYIFNILGFQDSSSIFSFPALESAVSPKILGFLKWRISFGSQGLGTSHAHCYWEIIDFRPAQWTEPGNEYLSICVSICKCMHRYLLIHKYIFTSVFISIPLYIENCIVTPILVQHDRVHCSFLPFHICI